MSLSALLPVGKSILFQFLDETGGGKGRFQERTSTGIIIPVLNGAQTTDNRWGKVVAVGSDVVGISPGEYIWIEALKWSSHETFNGEKVWRTIDDVVLCVTDDITETVKW
jgi:hypothetical protein